MSEIHCKRWTQNNRVSQAHLFLDDCERALCSTPRTPAVDRVWETLLQCHPGDICWTCQDRKAALERKAAR